MGYRLKFIIICLVSFVLIPLSVQAQEANKEAKQAKKEAVKNHLKQHFKPYGFIRNYFTYDSRESISGTGDMYNYQPKDESWNQTPEQAEASHIAREDLNAVSTFRFLSLTTRIGLNIMDYQWRGMGINGTIEADFYAGLSGTNHKVSGTAQLRLRQAFVKLSWDSLPMGKDLARVDLSIGQTWHPMAADLCDVIALNSGAPFGPFNRSPQVKMDARLGRLFTLTAAGLWQMQYQSTGPNGQSAEYMTYSKTPEAYLGLSVHDKGWTARVGADVLSICPRQKGQRTGTGGVTVNVTVKDRITTVSPFAYVQYKKGDFSFKVKTIFAEAGEHMNMEGGYGVTKVNKQDGSWEYTPLRTSATWVSIVYGGKLSNDTKLQGILFGGNVQNLGTKDRLVDADKDGKVDLYTLRPNNMNRMYRLSPTILWTIGKFQLGCEYEVTSVQYGSGDVNVHGIAQNDLHWVTNHRVQVMTKYNF